MNLVSRVVAGPWVETSESIARETAPHLKEHVLRRVWGPLHSPIIRQVIDKVWSQVEIRLVDQAETKPVPGTEP